MISDVEFARSGALATVLTLWALVPADVLGHDAVFDGLVVADRAVAAWPSDAVAVFRGQVIGDADVNRQVAYRAAKGVLNAALPLGNGPREAQHSPAKRQPQKPQIGIRIGVSIGSSSNAPARKPLPVGPIR